MPLEFNEEQYTAKSATILGSPKTPKMVEILVKNGVVNSKEKGMKVLIWTSIVLLLVAILILLFFVFDVGSSNEIDPKYIIQTQ